MTVFGTTRYGATVEKLTIAAGDLSVDILTFGAIVHAVRFGAEDHSLALGSDNLADYEADMGYFGAIVGPIANRISTSRVRLDGMMYELDRNENGKVHLHSGADGVHQRIWEVAAQSDDSVTLSLRLADGDAGLPGKRDIRVTYRVAAPASLTMTIDGTTDTTTCMNFASHIYWNLDGSDTWIGHHLRVAADHYLPVNDQTCPTGEIADVTGTDMDFRQGIVPAKGAPALDHNFCLSDGRTALRDVLWLTGQSGLKMTLATTEPGMQIHDAAGSHRPGKPPYEGLVIEPQGWPDAPNHRSFPSIKVTPEAPYQQISQWRFEKT
ncbi:MAG: aldose epimerase family protein [Yoonia sp.]|uniref:aldose epimerase family protein n=1 Tax=Yoonia sp. TaxID=2212373 RepID=UPI003EFB06AF